MNMKPLAERPSWAGGFARLAGQQDVDPLPGCVGQHVVADRQSRMFVEALDD